MFNLRWIFIAREFYCSSSLPFLSFRMTIIALRTFLNDAKQKHDEEHGKKKESAHTTERKYLHFILKACDWIEIRS